MASDRTRGPLVFETSDGRWALRVGPCAVVVGAGLVLGGVMTPLAPLGVAAFVLGLAAIARQKIFVSSSSVSAPTACATSSAR